MTVFVYGDKPSLTSELVGFARDAGVAVVALSFPGEGDLRGCGADKVYRVEGAAELPEAYAKSLAAFLANEGAQVFAVAATPRGRALAAQVAGYLHCGMASDVSGVQLQDSGMQTTRIIYGGIAQRTECFEGLSVVTVPSGMFEQALGECPVETVELEADGRYGNVETSPIVTEGVDLAEAERVISVGRGVASLDDLELVQQLARELGAEIGCTRPIAEEQKWLSGDHYIGISGKVVKPKLLLSAGVSGQVQHVFGLRDSRIIAAIDTNENAPIFQAADYGIVGDLKEIVPAITEALKNN